MPPLTRGQLPHPTRSPEPSRTSGGAGRATPLPGVGGRRYLHPMPTITIEPATSDRFDDAEHVFDAGGDGRSCQCQWWTLTNADFTRTDQSERRDLFEQEIAAGPPPGLNAELLAAAIDFARKGGARVIEAYPIDGSVGTHPVNDLYHGLLSTFEN